jgi:DedD protein
VATVAAPPARTALVVAPAAQEVEQVAPAGAVALAPPPGDVGAYTVQVGASQDRTEIARLESRVRGAGLKPYVVEARLGAKGTWYRVRVGSFRDKDSANRFRKDVERELRTAAVVMPTR